MRQEDSYEDAVRRLMSCGYEVYSDGQHYIVRCRADAADVSRCRNLGELVELADLFEWRERRQPAQQVVLSGTT